MNSKIQRIQRLLATLALLAATTLGAMAQTADELARQVEALARAERYPEALELCIKGLETADAEGDGRAYVACTGYIANIYETFGDYAGSLRYHQLGYEKSLATGDTVHQSTFLVNMVIDCCRQNDLAGARRYFELSRRQWPNPSTPNGRYYRLYNEAQILHLERRYDEALSRHEAARRTAAAAGLDSIYQLYQQSEMSLVLLDARRYDEAMAQARRCEQMAILLGSRELEAEAQRAMAQACDGRGLADEAESHRSRYALLRDSVYDMRRFYELRARLTDYENRKMNEQIGSLTATIGRQWVVLGAVAVSLALIALAFVLTEVRRRRHERTAAAEQPAPDAPSPTDAPPQPTLQLTAEQTRLLRDRIADVMADLDVVTRPDFSLQVLSDMVRSNTRYVSHVINETYHQNFNSLLNQRRIGEATRRLADTATYGHITIQAIYEDLGYTNAMSFNRAFKRIVGMTPSQFQRTPRT